MALFKVPHPERARSAESKDVQRRSNPYDDICPASAPDRVRTDLAGFGQIRQLTPEPADE